MSLPEAVSQSDGAVRSATLVSVVSASGMRACCWGQPRGTQRRWPTQREDEDALTQAIVTLASQYGRYGYRRIMALLQRYGWHVGKDRVERICVAKG